MSPHTELAPDERAWAERLKKLLAQIDEMTALEETYPADAAPLFARFKQELREEAARVERQRDEDASGFIEACRSAILQAAAYLTVRIDAKPGPELFRQLHDTRTTLSYPMEE